MVDLKKAADPIIPHIPTTGWISEYMKWSEQSEPPKRFRFAVAMGLVSSVLNRKIFIPYENRGTYPNLWLLLMGPPGCGKDNAINQGYDLFMQLEERPKIIAEKITPEALVKALATPRSSGPTNPILNRDCTGVLFAPELSTFLGRTRYNEGMITLLTRLFDCPNHFPTETLLRSNITLTKVCFNVLWGTNPDWYVRYMPEGAMCGGFMSRILYVFYLKREKRIPNPPPFDKIHETRLLNELIAINEMKGPVTFDDRANRIYNEWYCNLPEANVDTEAISGFASRKPIMVKKISMVLMASETREKVLRPHHIQQAINIMDILEKHLDIEVPKMGSSESAVLTDYIAHTIALKSEGMSRREVMQRTYRRLDGKRDEFDRIVDWLLQLGIVEQYRNGDNNEICYRSNKEAAEPQKN